MKDILPADSWRWQRLEKHFRRLVELHGFREIRTPIVEPTELFVREIGSDTDVVEKEMYSFERHGDALTVRPEGTASAARAYVQHAVNAREPVSRWYYLGAMFRAERPAKGRYRQFHQAGCEHFGDPGPLCDAEMIALCAQIVSELGIRDAVVHVSSLGSGDSRERYREALRQHFAPIASQLSEDSRRRLTANPLRILDSKSPEDREAIERAPSMLDVLGPDDAEHFARLRTLLDRLQVHYVVDPKLVRGLDYYTRTLFELKITSGELGAQDALLGGGRYDQMVERLGGPRVPAIGFAMGLERVLEVMAALEAPSGPTAYLAPMGTAAQDRALELGRALREAGIECEVDGRGLSVRAMLRRANALGARFTLLLGDQELARGVVTVKDLAGHAQSELALDALPAQLAALAAQPRAAVVPAQSEHGDSPGEVEPSDG